jgi:hypothetical protein
MMTIEEALKLGKQKYYPRILKAQINHAFGEGDFKTYAITEKLFSDPKLQ